jgi:hypothetical protein
MVLLLGWMMTYGWLVGRPAGRTVTQQARECMNAYTHTGWNEEQPGG